MKSIEGKVNNTNDIYEVILPYFVDLNKETKIIFDENESIFFYILLIS